MGQILMELEKAAIFRQTLEPTIRDWRMGKPPISWYTQPLWP